MGILGLPIYTLLAAILHMGNVKFENNDLGYAQIAENSKESFQYAANLLKINNTRLKDALLSRNITMPCRNHSENLKVQNNMFMAARTRDSIIKQLYTAVFQFLVKNINEIPNQRSNECIGILDIAGFGDYLTIFLLFDISFIALFLFQNIFK